MISTAFRKTFSWKNSIYFFVGSITLGYLIHYFKKKITITNNGNGTKSFSLPSSQSQEILIREQLKRNYEFFGENGMELIQNSFVCVVGIGGVGSHAVMTLIRSGVGKIRVIDYDIVTLSSLNRHAFACRSDVGKLKVRVVKEYAEKINPNTVIEMIDDAFLIQYAERYIKKDNPDYVIDCIDDLEAKCELIKYCTDNNIQIISSMGAGAKCDPTSIRIANFHFLQGDKIGKRLRYHYKSKFDILTPNIKTVYSLEKPTKGLTELEEHQKENVNIYRVNENERVRSLPVFASIPAIFGQTLSASVLCDLAKVKMMIGEENEKGELNIGNVSIKKLFEDFKKDERTKKKTNENELNLTFDDFLRIAHEFNCTSSVSEKNGGKMKFVRWDPYKPPTVDNIIILSKSEINKHFEIKSEADLLRIYGEEVYNRICRKLKKLGS